MINKIQQADVIIAGSGPAGCFAALELVRLTGLKVVVLEQARRLHDTREVANGFMGGSSRSDVRLFLTPGFGGEIKNPHIFQDLVELLEQWSRRRVRVSKNKLPEKMIEVLAGYGVEIDDPDVAVLNSDVMGAMEKSLYNYLLKKLDFHSNCALKTIERVSGGYRVDTDHGVFQAKYCLLGLGRGGAHWLKSVGGLDVETQNPAYDLGIRLEFPQSVMAAYTEKSLGFRLRFGQFRTTAITENGTVELEEVHGIKTTNGRSMSERHTAFSNVGLLQRIEGEGALERVLNVVQIVNILYDGQLFKEPISRLMNRSSQLCHLPEFDQMRAGVEKMCEVWPHLRQRCVFYAPEARINAVRFTTNDWMETNLDGLYVIGDMSGQTKSFVQAAVSGMLAGRNVAFREGGGLPA